MLSTRDEALHLMWPRQQWTHLRANWITYEWPASMKEQRSFHEEDQERQSVQIHTSNAMLYDQSFGGSPRRQRMERLTGPVQTASIA